MRIGVYAVIGAAVLALALALGTVQAASDAIFSSAAAPSSLPARLPPSLGVRLYKSIASIAPAPYVQAMLAQAEFDRGNYAGAQAYAQRLPPSPRRSDMLGKIARKRGLDALAESYFLQANDVFAITADVNRLAVAHPAAAYRLEMRLKNRLQQLTTHPDAVAEAYWRLGQLSTARSYRRTGSASTAWLERGMRDYRHAIALAPLAEKYLLAAGAQALNLGEIPAARQFYRRAADVDPASADAYAGLGIAALDRGHLALARSYAARSAIYDPHSRILQTLLHRLP